MLNFEHVSMVFTGSHGSVEAVRDFSLSINRGEFWAVVGPSGAGKTTLLKVGAGLQRPTSGRVTFNGREVVGTAPERGMVFQDFTLFPWLTVAGNISFGPRNRGVSNGDIDGLVSHYLKLTGLTQFATLFPQALSGGMQQRVAIARTLANDPSILFLDEPFGALDAQVRSQMQEFLAHLWEMEQKTVLLVTHDIEEALFLADCVCVVSARPATVIRTIPIEFPRPRVRQLKFSVEFIKMKEEIWGLLI